MPWRASSVHQSQVSGLGHSMPSYAFIVFLICTRVDAVDFSRASPSRRAGQGY